MFKDQKNLYVVKIMKITEFNDITTHFLTMYTNHMIHTKGVLEPDQLKRNNIDNTAQSIKQNKLEDLSEVIFKLIKDNQ